MLAISWSAARSTANKISCNKQLWRWIEMHEVRYVYMECVYDCMDLVYMCIKLVYKCMNCVYRYIPEDVYSYVWVVVTFTNEVISVAFWCLSFSNCMEKGEFIARRLVVVGLSGNAVMFASVCTFEISFSQQFLPANCGEGNFFIPSLELRSHECCCGICACKYVFFCIYSRFPRKRFDLFVSWPLCLSLGFMMLWCCLGPRKVRDLRALSITWRRLQ